MKKIVAMMLVLVMSITTLVGCGGSGNESAGSGAETGEARLVGVVMNDTDEELQAYLTNEVGPALNLKFDFSEPISDNEQLVTFIENERTKGAVGIINQNTNGAEQAAALCDEYGMYIVNWESAMKESIKDIPHNMGSVGGSIEGIAEAYGAGVANAINDGKEHSIVIFSGAASYGAQSHVYTASAALEAFQKQYNLTYEKDIMELATTSEVGEIETGNDNIKIYMVPGTDATAAAQTVSTQLQTGKYDMFIAVFQYAQFTGYIDEVEKALGIDVKILTTAPIKENTQIGFTTLDNNGNSVLDAAILNPICENGGIASLLIYLGVEGKADAVKVDGQAQQYHVKQWLCEDADTYAKVMELNSGEGTYVLSGETLLAMAENISVDSLKTKLASLSDIEQIIAEVLNK